MLRRLFIAARMPSAEIKFVATACAISLIGTLAVPASFAETGWQKADRKVAAKAVKKKRVKKKKKMTAGNSSGRMRASMGANGRRLAQLDEEFNGDLEAELMRDESGDSASGLGGDLESALGDMGDEAPATDFAAPTYAEPTLPQEPAAAPTIGEDVQITDIQYDSKKSGGTVLVLTTGAATYRTREIPSQNQVVVEIANAKLPDRLKRPFNTKDFRQAVVSVNAYQEAGSNTARVVLQFRQPRSIEVTQDGAQLSIVTAAMGASGSVASSAAANGNGSSDGAANVAASEDFDSGDDSMAGEDVDMADSSTASSGASSASSSGTSVAAKGSGRILPSSTLDQERIGDVRFYGKPISIEVRDTPVRDVITLISEQSGANIIMSDDVQGSITIKLRQIPWDQALAIIMKTRGLGYIRQGSVLRIAPIRQIQAEAEEARRILEAQEATLPLRVKVIPVSFASVTLLAGQIRNVLQGGGGAAGAAGGGGFGGATTTSRGRVEADARSSSIVVTDTDENIRKIEQLIKALDTAPLQVMIEGKIVEAKEEMGRRLGVNWGYQGQDLGFAGGTLSHRASINPTVNVANTTLDLKLGTLDFLGDLNAKLSLFENEQIARVISSPRVITMNAQPATIEQSVSIAVPTTTVTTGAPSQTSFTYKAIPTTLSVTPQITPGGDVLMNIAFRREFQSGGGGGAEVPIESRDVKTNVMVKNGQTTVIGGIYQADQTEVEEGTPVLRKIPILGWLFKSKTQTSVRNELLVFITPRILNADRTLPKSSSVQ